VIRNYARLLASFEAEQ